MRAGGIAASAASEALPPLALYLHFPWCVQKCPYCDFNSHQLRDELPEQRYIDALTEDLAAQAPLVIGRQITSIFMGGGTPSLFAPSVLSRLLAIVRNQLQVSPAAEVTMEANPATVERGRFAEYHAAGINRVSLGAQSFNSDTLRLLGRIHQPVDVLRAAEELHACGLTNFNIDLMYALPNQSLAGALADVTSALHLQPAHLSHYQLTLEPGTLFAAQPPPLPDDDLAWEMQGECQVLLAAHGFAQYEVSAYSRPGRQCAHNLNYWNHGDYLGIGAGAHGKLTHLDDSGSLTIRRSTHLREPRRYLASAGVGPQWRDVPQADLPFEFMMNALRLNAGFVLSEAVSRGGVPEEVVRPTLEQLAHDGLMETENARWRATQRGRTFLNDVIQHFLPGPKSQAGAGS
jgi:putative oxygen-independent coproporphyrinogen III oxidase